MDKLECMKRFVVVAQTCSFTRASERLDVPKSAISNAITQLEALLNTRLLHRSTRRVTLSAAGEQYLPQCIKLLEEFDALEEQFQQQTEQVEGVVRVDMPGRFYSAVVAPRLQEWFAMHPNTNIRLMGADFRIDPVKERVDCVVRVGELEDSELVARPIGKVAMTNCISARYAKRYGVPKTLEQLPNHYVVDYQPSGREQKSVFEYVDDGKTHFLAVPSLVSVSTTDAYLASCLAGLGIVQLPRHGVESEIASGELIEILPEYVCQSMPLTLLYESRHYVPRRVRAFMDWLVSVVTVK